MLVRVRGQMGEGAHLAFLRFRQCAASAWADKVGRGKHQRSLAEVYGGTSMRARAHNETRDQAQTCACSLGCAGKWERVRIWLFCAFASAQLARGLTR
jgi:hypothetical protein